MNLLLAAQRKSVLVIHLFEMQSESISHSFLKSCIGHWSKNISAIMFPHNEEITASEIRILVTIEIDITYIVLSKNHHFIGIICLFRICLFVFHCSLFCQNPISFECLFNVSQQTVYNYEKLDTIWLEYWMIDISMWWIHWKCVVILIGLQQLHFNAGM